MKKKKSKAVKEIYYNPKQIEFLNTTGKVVKVFKGGRGSGKTRIIPEDILLRASELPRARIFLASYTYDQIYDNIVPDIHDVFKEHGLIEGRDYVVDKRPPDSFIKPYKKIEKYNRSLSLFNGFSVQFVSLGRYPGLVRGRSFDGGILDEALLINEDTMSSILLPTQRGLDHWRNNPYWKMLSIYTSHPRKPESMWILQYKKLAAQLPWKYFYMEATAYDNIEVLGQDYIDDLEQTMNFVDFSIEVMNTPVRDIPSMFYYRFNVEKHTYRYDFELDGRVKIESKVSGRDTDINAPFDVSFDFGGRYSCMSVSQTRGNTEYFVNEFDTNNITDAEKKSGVVKKLPHIVADFCGYYQTHHSKHVNIWGDRTGTHQAVVDEYTYYETIQGLLSELGWTSTMMIDSSNDGLHKSRWFLMNECFAEASDDLPRIRINANRCPNLISSLSNTRITDDFKKDKKDERNIKFNQSTAPHLSDTFDNKLFKKYAHLLTDSFSTGSHLDNSLTII